jgi:GntR family transcriptional regulator of vanillate catabolism
VNGSPGTQRTVCKSPDGSSFFDLEGYLRIWLPSCRNGDCRPPGPVPHTVDEGLLERIETGGCRVASFTLDDIKDAIELRGVLEGTAARLAAERGMVPEIGAQMEKTLDLLDEAVRPDHLNFRAYVRLNEQFHDCLARLAGSAIVAREVDRASRLPAASPTAFLQGQELIPDFRASLRRAQLQHRMIFEAIKAREGSRAEALAREHARLALNNLSYVTVEAPGLAEQVPGLALITD